MGYFESWSEFISMGSHGPFVWSVYGLTVATMIGLAVGVRIQKRRVLAEVRRMHKRGQV